MKATSVSQENLDRYARMGLWALPLFGLANFIGTLSSQPNYNKDFPGYARYISTSPFLASHLAASIFGAGIGILGFTALFVYLVRGSDRPGIALAAFVMTIVGSMGLVALFGLAAFAQRAIGKAYLAGHHDVVGVNSTVYGTPLFVTAGVALVLFCVGVILFAIAIAISGSESLPRLAGVLFAVAVPVFAIGSLLGGPIGPIGALLEMGSTIWIARSASAAARPIDAAAASSQRHLSGVLGYRLRLAERHCNQVLVARGP
jgi:hypothetical protein